jgi:hypothetical protein
MSVNQEEKKENKPEKKPKPMVFRRSSLKNHQQLKFDPGAIMNPKNKRNSVSWGKSNTFEFKAMKASFKEAEDLNKKESKEDKEKHQAFLKNRKASIKNEFSLIKELMKKSPDAIIEEEENDDEAKKNMKQNIEMGKEALKEEDTESSKSKSNTESDNESKNSSKSVSKSSQRKSSKNETDDEKNIKNEKKNKNEKSEKENDKNIKVSKLKNKKEYKDEKKDVKDIIIENNEPKTEKFSIKNNKKPKFAEKEEVIKKKEIEKEKEIKKNENEKEKEKENKEGEKIRLMELKDAQHLELEKIAYIVLTDGNIVIIKNQGENLVKDLLTIQNPLLKQNQIKKSQISKPLQPKSFPKKENAMQKNQNDLKLQNNFQENKYKSINNNIERNSSYNSGIGSQFTRKTYSITNSPNYPITLNKSITMSKSYYLNQVSQKYQYPNSNNRPDIDNNNNDYQKFNNYNNYNNILSKYKNQIKTERNKSGPFYGTSKSINYNQNQLPIHSNYLAQKSQYIGQSTRNLEPNYVEPSNNKNIYKNKIRNKSRTNYLNYIESSREYNFRSTPIERIGTYNSDYNQSNPQLLKTNYNQNIKDQIFGLKYY